MNKTLITRQLWKGALQGQTPEGQRGRRHPVCVPVQFRRGHVFTPIPGVPESSPLAGEASTGGSRPGVMCLGAGAGKQTRQPAPGTQLVGRCSEDPVT